MRVHYITFINFVDFSVKTGYLPQPCPVHVGPSIFDPSSSGADF